MIAPASPVYPVPPSRTQANITLVAAIVAIAIAIGSPVYSSGALAQRLAAVEESTQPLRDGDLVRVQTDVAWIRRHLEENGE